MNKTLPYIFFAAIIHGAFVILLAYSPGQKKPPKLLPFKEKLVILHEQPSLIKTSISSPAPQTQKTINKPVEKNTPSQQPVKQKPSEATKKNPISKPLEKEKSVSKQPEKEKQKEKIVTKQSPSRETKLKAIADLTKTLSKHLDDSDSRVDALSSSQKLSIQTSLAETQEEELCQLLREYIVLPFSGEVRVKLMLTPYGQVQECVVLSHVSEAEKQLILIRIHEIPFKKFLDKYKISKNIVFHIKLLSNES
ncbi:inclusion-associated protein [Chlamydia vaughanii]|uniref:inclusion-associated protein n=1 Tax=Chlamydia vaughanii TaxID=3112552 RepID=UPI0032B13B3E